MSSSLTSKSCCVCFSDLFSSAESLSSLSTIPLRRLNTLEPASVFILVALGDGWFTDPVRALLVGRRPLLSVSEDATTEWIITYRLKLYTLKTSNWNPSLATNFRNTARSQLMSVHNHAILEKQTQNYQLLHTLDEHKRNSQKGGETED